MMAATSTVEGAHRAWSQRQRLESAIEAAIGLLDAMDGDADLEAGADLEAEVLL